MKFIIVDDGQVRYHNPLGENLSTQIENLVRQGACFVPSFVTADEYSIESYIVEQALARTEVTFLLDRNIYTQALSLVKGEPANNESRFAAAVMAFANCADAKIEPNLALYEGAASGAKGGWKRDLRLFRASDNIDPINWALVALKRSDGFSTVPPRLPANTLSTSFDPRMQVRSFRNHYPLVLKIAELMRSPATCNAKMIAYFDWVFEHWLFSAPAMALATLAFARQPRKTPIQGANSLNREVALKNLKNATWDVVYVSEWYRRTKIQWKTNEVTVICTRDAALRELATVFRRLIFETNEVEVLHKSGYSRKVIQRFTEVCSSLDQPERRARLDRLRSKTYRSRLIAQLEAEFLSL